MIDYEALKTIIMHEKPKCIRVKSGGGDIILTEDGGTDACLSTLEEYANILKHYGVVEIWGSRHASNWQTPWKWRVKFGDDQKPAGQMGITQQSYADPWAAFKNMPPQLLDRIFGKNDSSAELMKLQIEGIKKDFEYKMKIHEIENDDPQKKYGVFAPLVMKAMGWKSEEIRETMGLMQTASNIKGSPTFVSNVQNKVDFDSLLEKFKTMSDEEKNKKIEELMNKLPEKISAEFMILVLEIFTNSDKEFPMLFVKCCQTVGIDKMQKLLSGLNAKPEFADVALSYIK